MNEVHTLSHSTWNCKYHIVFAPKYRRKVFYGEKRYEIGKLLRTLCKWKGVNVLEAEACPDHIHMLVEIPPKISVSGFMGYLKGKAVCRYTKRGATSNTSTRIENSGAKGIMWIQLGKIQKR